MATRFDPLRDHLRETLGEDLRWLASFDAESYDYDFHHVREDLETDLTDRQLDYVVHRSLAVFNKRHVDGIYFNLGESSSLVADYERGRAVHGFLDDRRGFVVTVEPDRDVSLPGFVEECREQLPD